ncbi:MAG: 4-(cytidine 5'-diphospho)-2-C-methyl-D-erythritol kinase [Actinomycetota bacterium]|nr:4-(cytidine 5'-diphospho)-2-C-methyl-D-erythritol kinase [Actinomycetota bacterium]
MQSLRFLTHGKVNLFLRVLGRRADGFHEIETILQVIDLSDEIEIVPTTTGSLEIEMSLKEGIVGEVPSSEDNLVSRAVSSLVEHSPGFDGLKVVVRKGVPIGAGLGGGSANAAGALVVLNELWKMGLEKTRLTDLAAELGSDVPYCVDGGTALATGRGEKLTSLPSPGKLWFVLGLSNDPLSTAKVYDAWDSLEEISETSSAPMTMAIGAGEPEEIAACLYNDLERAAFSLRPELRDLKQSMLDADALGACMSGSGPTIAGLAASRSHAQAIAARVSPSFDAIKVVASRSECIVRLD